jgi:hypothetical protein
MTRDIDIRSALVLDLRALHGDDPETLLVDELGVDEGSFRIDYAVVNGQLAGFEIKSDRDTLSRLAAQARAYGRVFDTLTLICGQRHMAAAAELVPRWWGVTLARSSGGLIVFDVVRPIAPNPGVDPFAVAQLLWRDEALEMLEQRELAAGLRSKPRRELWRALARHVDADELRAAVRDRLRARRAWRAELSPG